MKKFLISIADGNMRRDELGVMDFCRAAWGEEKMKKAMRWLAADLDYSDVLWGGNTIITIRPMTRGRGMSQRRCFLMRDGINYVVMADSPGEAARMLNVYCGSGRIYNYTGMDFFACIEAPALVSGYDFASQQDVYDAWESGKTYQTNLTALKTSIRG